MHWGGAQRPKPHELPAGQTLHWVPMLPHEALLCIAKDTHLPSSQQPPGQLDGLQTGIELHEPPLHSSPGPHETHAFPLTPQLVTV